MHMGGFQIHYFIAICKLLIGWHTVDSYHNSAMYLKYYNIEDWLQCWLELKKIKSRVELD